MPKQKKATKKQTTPAPSSPVDQQLKQQAAAAGAQLAWQNDHWLLKKERSTFRVYDDTPQHDIDRFLSGAASNG